MLGLFSSETGKNVLNVLLQLEWYIGNVVYGYSN